MDSCLSTDLIIFRIISKLNLREKFGVQILSRRWKIIAIQCLRHHEYLVINKHPPSSYWRHTSCDEHSFLVTVNNDNSIWAKPRDLEFWKRTLSLLPGVKYLNMDKLLDDSGNFLSWTYKPILQLIIDCCGQSLECLCLPEHEEYEEQGEIFPLIDFLPHLKHMIVNITTSHVTEKILNACPNLEYLRSDTSFTEWQILPKGFKKLHSRHFDGINNLLCSPAVQSLEVVRGCVMTSEICYESYHLSCLKTFEVIIDIDVTSCLTHLARILSFAPVLCELTIRITAFDEIESEVWMKVLSQCQTITKLRVFLKSDVPRINVSSWQDNFVEALVSSIKKLEYLDIGFHLSCKGLRLLSQLENLQYFHHKIHTEKMSYDSVFDTDALIDFLSSSLDKKLKDYEIHISEFNPFRQYLRLKESFYDFIEKMERKHFVRFHMLEDRRQRYNPNTIPGMIYVTDLNVGEWDLMLPGPNFPRSLNV